MDALPYDKQIVIVDDGSTDGTPGVLAPWGGKAARRRPPPDVLYNTTISDMETGYKAFRIELLRSLDLECDDFGVEPEITAKVCKRKLRIYELPVSYYGLTYAEGKKITWRDGFKAIRVLLDVRFRG